MEESGHYYTVYYTSLAVGFDEDIAYRHAVMAQMPDEVGYLDAANMHIRQCSNFSEIDLSGNKRSVPNEWRFLIEYIIHSLPDKNSGNLSSAWQRRITGRLLMSNRPDSLEFGLLLHRLGDTYAHSVMGDEAHMYSVGISGELLQCFRGDTTGHGLRAGSNPDYPFLRPSLFYDYLEDMYGILAKKVSEKDSLLFRRKTQAVQIDRLKSLFRKLLEGRDSIVPLSMRAGLMKTTTQVFFIQKIREACKYNLGISMKAYAPERIEKQTLAEFLAQHPELHQLGIDRTKIEKALNNIRLDLQVR